MAKFCTNCGNPVEPGQKMCVNCGAPIQETEYSTPSNQNTYTNSARTNGKNKIVAGILGIFLGAFGVHNFYLGYTSKAVAQLLITILSCFILSFVSEIWGFIEGIMILTGSINTDADGNPLTD